MQPHPTSLRWEGPRDPKQDLTAMCVAPGGGQSRAPAARDVLTLLLLRVSPNPGPSPLPAPEPNPTSLQIQNTRRKAQVAPPTAPHLPGRRAATPPGQASFTLGAQGVPLLRPPAAVVGQRSGERPGSSPPPVKSRHGAHKSGSFVFTAQTVASALGSNSRSSVTRHVA